MLYFLSLLLLTFNINAKSLVIYDNSNISESIKPYLPFKKPTQQEINQTLHNIPKPENINLNNLIDRFPIITHNMSVGRVAKRTIQYAPNRAICLVGYDDTSLGWLERNHQFLASINTLCFVVNIKTKKEFKSLKANFSDLSFQAMSADNLVEQLQIRHYPVLIYKGSIEQ